MNYDCVGNEYFLSLCPFLLYCSIDGIDTVKNVNLFLFLVFDF